MSPSLPYGAKIWLVPLLFFSIDGAILYPLGFASRIISRRLGSITDIKHFGRLVVMHFTYYRVETFVLNALSVK